jgi:hypothetical protein
MQRFLCQCDLAIRVTKTILGTLGKHILVQLSQRQDAYDNGSVDPIWCNATATAAYGNGDLWIYWLVISYQAMEHPSS